RVSTTGSFQGLISNVAGMGLPPRTGRRGRAWWGEAEAPDPVGSRLGATDCTHMSGTRQGRRSTAAARGWRADAGGPSGGGRPEHRAGTRPGVDAVVEEHRSVDDHRPVSRGFHDEATAAGGEVVGPSGGADPEPTRV